MGSPRLSLGSELMLREFIKRRADKAPREEATTDEAERLEFFLSPEGACALLKGTEETF